MSDSLIETSSGGWVDFANLEDSAFKREDVAHALSIINRFTGHTVRPYSVGEHTLHCAEYLKVIEAPTAVQLAGLHHDDQEAYIGDQNRPLKQRLADFQAVEAQITPYVQRGVGVSDLPWDDSRIKQADNWMLMYEAYWLLASHGSTWENPTLVPHEPGVTEPISFRPSLGYGQWDWVKDRWLKLDKKLYNQMMWENR